MLLVACGNDVSVTHQRIDDDSDGYFAGVDCDDAHATVNPDAEEVCDGLDNDCDGAVDAGAVDASSWSPDTDRDGFGAMDGSVTACEAPEGYVEDATDCDDAQAGSFPGKPEVCDGLDNDCDGAVDDDATDVTTSYADADGDGFGDATSAAQGCGAPDGYVADGSDCDDAAAEIHPDASEGDCTDPVDYNCDGATGYADGDLDGWAACEDCDDADGARNPGATEVCDAGDLDEDCSGAADDLDAGTDAASMTTWTRDADGDAYGPLGGLTLTQCEPPSGYATATGDCDDTDAAVNPGATERCDALDTDEDCDGGSDDGDASTDAATFTRWYRDGDTDAYGDATRSVLQCDPPSSYVADATDCDDTTAAVNPGALEVCDPLDVDEDCDSLADDADPSVSGGTSWYRDADGDGSGGAGTTSACAAPAGYVATSDDCDDGDATVSPSAAEVCDPVDRDEDCDGLVDDEDPSATRQSAWYADGDGDGYGGVTTTSACEQPSGYAASSTDCDDANAAVSPGATEVCDAADTDEDCDGLADDASSVGTSTWYADADGDGFGSAASTLAACDLPLGYTVDSTDCSDSSADISPEGTEVCGDGIDQDCSGADAACPGVRWPGTGMTATSGYDVYYRGVSGNDLVGYGLTAGDFDGDGVGDLVVAAAFDAIGSSSAQGNVYGYYGGLTAGAQDVDDYYDARWYSTGSSNQIFGDRLANLGDVDGDGTDDLGVSCLDYTSGHAVEQLYVMPGAAGDHSAGTGDSFDCFAADGAGSFDSTGSGDSWVCGDQDADVVYVFSDGVATSTLTSSGAYWGAGAAGGSDLDGDGVDDIAVGSETNLDAGAHVFYGPGGGTIASSDADVILTQYGGATAWVDLPGDLDGDGYGDVATIATYLSTGDLFLTSHVADGVVEDLAYAAFTREDAGDYLNTATFGDFDGDGNPDVAASSSNNADGGTNAGGVWVVYGPHSGTLALAGADASWVSSAASDYLGWALAAVPDTNGDGYDELAMGAPFADPSSRRDAGYVAVWYGE